MKQHVQGEDQAVAVPRRRPERDEGSVAPAEAVFEAAERTPAAGRGGSPAVGRAIDGMQSSAGNAAIAHLFAGPPSIHRAGPTQMHAAHAPVAPSVQRDDEEEEVAAGWDDEVAGLADQPAGLSDQPAAADLQPAGDAQPIELGGGAQATGQSWTKVGPPKPASYNVSGTLRQAATTVAARTEAGSVTTTPSLDTDAPVTGPGGTEIVPAARVTVAQVLEMPTWTDKSSATKNQQAEWDRFHGALSTHEAGHVSTDKTAYADAHTRIKGKSPADGDTAFDAVTTKATTDNDTYDSTTQHGITQGTGINPNIDEVTKVP